MTDAPEPAPGLGARVELPKRAPWIPPAPAIDREVPIVMPDLATLERVLDALYRLPVEEHPARGEPRPRPIREEP